MRYLILGPVAAAEGSRELELGGGRQRALLALLLLRRNEVVSVDRIVDELWGERAPATATKVIQGYVSQLRKVLGESAIVTRTPGYVLEATRDQVDADRFEDLLERARREEPGSAAATLREALGVWRGPPLADMAYESFAQAEISRLEELRLVAIESRIDADLALGEAEGLVPELNALVAEHPLRERLRAQLMLALYRTGRQAEALDTYNEGRRVLVDELGIEPGPELQELQRRILAQDPELGPIVRPTALALAARHRWKLIGAGAMLLVAAALGVALALTRDNAEPIVGPYVAEIDPVSGRVLDRIPVGGSPVAVSATNGGVWVLNADDRTLSKVDPETKSVRTLGIGAVPTDVVAGAGAVWVGNGGKVGRAQFAGSTATALTRLDLDTGAARATIPLPRLGAAVSNETSHHIALAGGAVWVIGPDYSIWRIDRETNEPMRAVSSLPAIGIAGRGDALWTLNNDGTVARISVRGNAVTARKNVPATTLTALAVGGGSVWATDPYEGTLWRIETDTRAQRTIDVGIGADSVAFGDRYAWVANSLGGTLTRVDPLQNRAARPIALGGTPRAVAVGAGRVWVAVAGESPLPSAGDVAGDVRPLPESFCGRILSGPDPPRFLIAADLPLQVGPRFPTLQMSAAAVHALRRHRFHAGKFAVGYQSCDDSTAQRELPDSPKCAANAKAYAENPDVIGVLGPFNSYCAYAQIPIANRAGLPIVSPTNSDPGLTRLFPGAPRGAMHRLYPTGRRNYVRLMSPDNAQVAGAAMLARRLGKDKIFVLHDGEYGTGFAFDFKRMAARLGEQIVGEARWNPNRPGDRALFARVAARRPDAVYLCGLIDTGAGEALATLRSALPAGVTVIACEGALPASTLFAHAGPAARGVYVTISGLVNERLAPTGRAFVRDFGATQPQAAVDRASVYTAQATEVMLAAIARSDGTRASVAEQLFKVRVAGGLLGSFAFDAYGDPNPAPISVVRLERAGGTNAVASYEGARVESVLRPSRSLYSP